MFRKIIILLILVGFGLKPMAQESNANLNDFKYVIVPVKYDFLKEDDQYQLNSLTKFLFEKYGFTAFMVNDELPDDYKKNNCLALQSNVLKESGLFKTKLTVQLKNCQGKILFTSIMGETREKDYKKAYQEALRLAFESFNAVKYHYEPNDDLKEQEVVVAENSQAEIEKLKAEIEQLKTENENSKIDIQSEEVINNGNVNDNAAVVKDVAVVAPIISTPQKEVKSEISNEVLYAQATDDGYQLVDSTPKIVYKLKKTGSDSMFLVESINGVLTKKENNWVLEYYDNGALIQKTLNIKF